MIKKIPIKGISRDPSAQTALDGACAESLNVQMDMGEVAPAMRPNPVKDSSGNAISVEGEVLFLHKGTGYENLLYRDGRNVLFSVILGDAQPGLVLDALGNDEKVVGTTSVGNTVVISTDKDMYYVLWRENAYHFLGNQIPVPAIHFRMGDLESVRTEPEASLGIDPSLLEGAKGFSRATDEAPVFPHENVGDVTEYGSSSKRYVFDSDFEKGFWNEFLDVAWGEIDEKVREQSRLGKAVFPMFVRYAVRLYDGTCYAQSIPVLLGADLAKYVSVEGIVMQMTGGVSEEEKNFLTIAYVASEVPAAYSIVMNAFDRDAFDGWEDIVTSVDVFVSPQIAPPQRNAAKFDMELVSKLEESLNSYAYHVKNFSMDPYYTEENQDKMVMNYQNAHLAKSFTVEEFKSLRSDLVLELDTTADYIMAQELLKETSQSMHHAIGGLLFDYNKRLLMTGTRQVLSHGYEFVHSAKWAEGGRRTFRFVYYLRGDNGENVVICRDENGFAQVSGKTAAVVSGSSTVYAETPCSWFAYPDSRCYRMDVFEMVGDPVFVASYDMKPMTQADVAYAFLGFGAEPEASGQTKQVPDEDLVYSAPNELFVSKANDPFVFPAEQRVSFTAGQIMNMAVATTPLSEGQFGQFPLYVFTDEGVFALSVDSDGSFQSSHPVSRDVLLSPEALVGVEQGVFFAAARGLLLLQGSKVTKTSSDVEGFPELPGRMSDDMYALVRGRLGMEEPLPFRKVLDGCGLAYDYANTRIIVFNGDCASMYAYKFDTQTWHRLQCGNGRPTRTLNSFPEAQIVVRNGMRQSVLDFSVLAEDEGSEPLPGLVYTRDLDLDAADVYKTIVRLKVRGRFADGHVKWQLQGSNDGATYKTVHSLRGPSWKWYRVVLLTNLAKDERISYLEMDYEPRFTDKIR